MQLTTTTRTRSVAISAEIGQGNFPWPPCTDKETSDTAAAPDDLLHTYLREIAHTPLLSAVEERALAARIAQGDHEARQQFIEANLRFVVHVATRYQGMGLPLLDLIQEGAFGLMRAVDLFDPTLGHKFSSYAFHWIKQAICRALDTQARTIRLPGHAVQKLRRVLSHEQALTQTLERTPSVAELAASVGRSPDEVRLLLAVEPAPLSLDQMTHGEFSDLSLVDSLLDEAMPSPEEWWCQQEAYQQETRPQIETLLACLTPRERAVVILRFGLDGSHAHGFAQIGRRLGICRERPRQLFASALEKLRAVAGAHTLLDRHAS